MKTITIVDYGVGNLGSIENMLKKIGVPFVITGLLADIARAQKIILPGVGAFDHAMQTLAQRALIPALEVRALEDRVPLLGVCLGMQLLTEGSDEGQLPGLGWISGRAHRFNFSGSEPALKVPHMGWNSIQVKQPGPLLEGLDDASRFYFVHSYQVQCADRSNALATAEYGVTFDCVIGKDNIMGAQFHPEKSHRYGMQLLANFARNF